MLYTLLTQKDIQEIEAILKLHDVQYEVIINEELIHEQNEYVKHVVDHRAQIQRSNAFYNLVIENEEFSKIPSKSKDILERYNIFPDLSGTAFHADTPIINSPFNYAYKKTSWIYKIFISAVLIFSAYQWCEKHLF
jgi:hypothetical protein